MDDKNPFNCGGSDGRPKHADSNGLLGSFDVINKNSGNSGLLATNDFATAAPFDNVFLVFIDRPEPYCAPFRFQS